jgi:hypothetical protein
LGHYYKNIIVTTKDSLIDWSCPVISVGGPLSNSVSRKIESQEAFPLRFLDTPYSKDTKRSIGSPSRADVFSPSFNIDGDLVSDVAYIVRLKSPHDPNSFILIFAGCYGKGTYGAIDYVLTGSNIRTIKRICRSGFFQLVIRSQITDDRVTKTMLAYHSELS